MTPETGTALIVLVAFVLPGFVVVLFQERTFKQAQEVAPFDRLLRTLYYSVWCYLLVAVAALVFGVDQPYVEHLYHRYEDDPAELVWRGALVVLGPATVVWLSTLLVHETGLSRRGLEAVHLNARHQEPTAWDHWLRKGLKSHVRVVYGDGRSVWGYYGEASFASYAKDGRDLFLELIYPEQAIEERGDSDEAPGPWFGAAHASNHGGWVNLDGAVCVEIYDFSDAQATEKTSSEPRRRPSRAGGCARPDQPPPVNPADGTDAAATTKEELS